jgi:SnoaL-like polyketide cyclase
MVVAPHPTATDMFAEAYSHAWTSDPQGLLEFFAPDGSYTDVAMDTTYTGHGEIMRFHRWMLKFAPDSAIHFYAPAAHDGHLYLEWLWSGSFGGPLRLQDGSTIAASGKKFEVIGVAACRYRDDGKLSSHRDFWDFGRLLHQLDQTKIS